MSHLFSRKPLVVGVLLGIGLIALPAIAQSNFGSVTLQRGFNVAQGTMRGNTGGRNSLPEMVTARDRDGNLCLGYGSSVPDHILVLDQSFDTLSLQVNSGGNDTALVVRGPGGVRCGDDTSRSNPDDRLQGTDWAAGSYEVWVGTSDPGARHNYTLTVGQ
ncbi:MULTISPECIES: hypothetical protein [unclassified Leptolyngbya]|uniref:hypothetical protein n=1 Tax=unclassified Leptolyngbya TaxID=2650499 RepID=UPI001681E9FB|nr:MULTISPECIES: hypothetical protein [unclassified Leptolyngbya]MBD1912021.1 hypothetical protein [Leptolyngbya sp. FACHB-8]MBD2155391.1 hypothetical protein [Leptolyngbya sp. FACHB-16]